MKTETFQDGSTIETNEETGNRTVCGKLAHDEYFKRLEAERIYRDKPETAVVSSCRDVDGTRKAELIRKTVTNPLTREWLGEYSWEVWTSEHPESVVRYMTEEKARKAFRIACIAGTNGWASAKEILEMRGAGL